MKALEERYPHLVKRPLVAVLPLFVIGLLAPDLPWMFALLPLAVVFAWRFLILGSFALAIGFLRVAMVSSPMPELPAGETKLVGTVASTPVLSLKLQRFELNTQQRTILVYEKPDRVIMAGDLVRVSGSLANFSSHDPSAQYWSRRGITQRLTAAWIDGTEVLAPGFGLSNWGSLWRNDMWSRLRRHLPQEEASIAMGIVAGQQSLVSKQTINDMQRAGTLHMLSTSGYNVMLLAAVLMLALSHLPLHRGLQLAFAIFVLLAYADAVGGRPPVIRATVMATLYLGAFIFGRTPDALSVWAAAAIGCLLIEPSSVYDAGYHLSFLSVFALILYLPGAVAVIESRIRKLRSAGGRFALKWSSVVVATTLIAGFASAPLTAVHFGQVSLISPVANLLTAPAVAPIYVGAASAQALEPASEPLSRGLDLALTGPFSAWIASVNNTLGGLSWAAVQVQPPAWLAALLLLLVPALSRPTRRDPAAESEAI